MTNYSNPFLSILPFFFQEANPDAFLTSCVFRHAGCGGCLYRSHFRGPPPTPRSIHLDQRPRRARAETEVPRLCPRVRLATWAKRRTCRARSHRASTESLSRHRAWPLQCVTLPYPERGTDYRQNSIICLWPTWGSSSSAQI